MIMNICKVNNVCMANSQFILKIRKLAGLFMLSAYFRKVSSSQGTSDGAKSYALGSQLRTIIIDFISLVLLKHIIDY